MRALHGQGRWPNAEDDDTTVRSKLQDAPTMETAAFLFSNLANAVDVDQILDKGIVGNELVRSWLEACWALVQETRFGSQGSSKIQAKPKQKMANLSAAIRSRSRPKLRARRLRPYPSTGSLGSSPHGIKWAMRTHLRWEISVYPNSILAGRARSATSRRKWEEVGVSFKGQREKNVCGEHLEAELLRQNA